MSNSLFEQLKENGLIDNKKAKKAKQNQYKNNKKQKRKKGVAAQLDETTLLAQQTHAEKVERDRSLNQQRKEEAEHKAIAAQIKQLIETNRVENSDGDIVYNFTDANAVKRIYISTQAHKHLISGHLVIAKLGESYELVPTPVANKIRQRDEQCVIMCEHSAEVEPRESEPYADYKIPDDLMW
jgi:uncharacterized protein YaiL (DUF2058 family)